MLKIGCKVSSVKLFQKVPSFPQAQAPRHILGKDELEVSISPDDILVLLRQPILYAKNNLVISHTDLDRKNVMWQEDKPFIIDWEASGYINPTIELIQVAWYWSGGDVENIDYNKFGILIKSYKKYYKGNIDKNAEDLVYADNYGGLG